MGGVTGFLNIVAATGGAALLLYSTDALFYYTDERSDAETLLCQKTELSFAC